MVETRSAVLLSPSALPLLAQVRDDPSAPLGAAVCAPGGYGKSALLAALAASYRAAGVPVRTLWQPVDEERQAVLLVDDAHLLGEDRLREVASHVDRPGARVVVAYRPWPLSAALSAVADVVRRHGAPVTLAPLAAAQVHDRCAEVWNRPASPEWVRFLLAQSGGVPRYVDRLVTGLAAESAMDAAVPERVPDTALAPFAADLAELDADTLTVLLALEAGAGLSLTIVAALLDRTPEQATALLGTVRATGLLAASGALLPVARQALALYGPVTQRVDIRRRMASWQLARGGRVLPVMRTLLTLLPRTGPEVGDAEPTVSLAPEAPSAGLGEAFLAGGDEALQDDPALAARLFDAASRAGVPAGARQALATALAGDLDLASLLADQVLTGGPADQRADAACVAAATLAHRNHLTRSVEMYRWATPRLAAGFGAVGLVGTGRLDEAERSLASAPDDPSGGPPTLLDTAAQAMARGVCESVHGSPMGALSALVQAAQLLEPSGSAVLLPDSPAALAALVALHCAEFQTAQAVLERAIESGVGGPLFIRRHRLLLAWTLMVQGRLAAAGEEATRAGVQVGADPATDAAGAATVVGSAQPYGRDLVFATALRAGLARRASDVAGIQAAWPDARQALIGQPVDLFTLLPLGEIAIAAARLGETRQVQPALLAAEEVLRRLAEPPLWAAPLHWSRLHAAILADDSAAVEQHVGALQEHRDHSAHAGALASAAQCWLDMLSKRVDPEKVEAAAREMADLGLVWDGARLAGQAGIRTKDRKAITMLLDCARSLQARQAPEGTAAPGKRGARLSAVDRPVLSEREEEVAALVLAGMTYRQVADRLYISAKTVEHHMARIRQRLGCADRGELLTQLRLLVQVPGEENQT